MISAFRIFAGVVLATGVVACTASGGLNQQGQQIMTASCMVDGEMQPIAASLLATLLPPAVPAVAFDTVTVHPAIVAYCKSLASDATAVAVAAPTVTAPATQ